MSLDLGIQRLLRSNEVKQINFTIGTLRVTGRGFWELSHRLADRPIPHRIRVTDREAIVGRNNRAAYDSGLDKIRVRSPLVLGTPAGRASVVHECTHAQLDLRGVSQRVRHEEGAAFVAQVWYLLACNEHVATVAPHLPSEWVVLAGNLRERAIRATGRPVELTSAEVDEMLDIVATNYSYRTGYYSANGIRGYRYRGP